MGQFEDIARFTGFDDSDRQALSALLPIAAPHFPSISARFYEQIHSDPEARAVLRDEAQVSRLKLTLVGWLKRLLRGPWNDDYHRARSRIGEVHVAAGLPQRFMLTAMSLIRVDLHRIVESAYADDPEARAAAHRAIARILDVDLAIMLESFRADSLAAVRRLQEVQRRLMAREVEVTEERSRAILDAAEIIAIVVSAGGQVTLFNQHAELTSGRSRTEVLDEADLVQIWHPSDRGDLVAALEVARSGLASPIQEQRIVGRDGRPRWIRWHIATLPSIGDPDVCLVGVDLTVERTLAERTRRAESLATLGTLAAGLAHEIRNPLNAAQLQLTLTERRIAREDGRERALGSIGIVRGELGRLATLVGDFLAFARPAPLRIHSCNLVDTAREVTELLASTAEGAEVTLAVEAPDAVAVDCDEQRMHQVLINLVRNAIEAAGRGGEVSLRVVREGPSAIVEVSDTGDGIPEGIEIFEPFATSKESGTGLGLSIVKRIVTDHGGRISTRRDQSRTVFELEIPVEGPPA